MKSGQLYIENGHGVVEKEPWYMCVHMRCCSIASLSMTVLSDFDVLFHHIYSIHRILMTGFILMRRQACSTSTKASVHTRETIFMDVYFTLTFFQLVWKGNVYASCRNQL